MTYKDESKDYAERRVDRVRRACGGEAEMRRIADHAAKEGVHEHERHDHRGEKPTALKFDGAAGKKRVDRARGGRTKSKPTEVNIIIDAAPGSGAGAGRAAPPGLPPGLPPAPMPHPMAAPPAIPRPPVVPPALAARPPMPAGPMPIRKRGGKVVDMDAGAGSGRGRLEKAAEYGART